MFKYKTAMAAILLILVIVLLGAIPATAHAGNANSGSANQTTVPEVMPEGVVAYYTKDGGNHWVPINEEKGVIEKIMPGMTKAEFMAQHAMSPAKEAAIIH